MNRSRASVALAVLLAACSPQGGPGDAPPPPQAGGDVALDSDDQRTLYALGVVLGQNIAEFALSAEEAEIVAAGLTDSALNETPRVEMATYGPQIQALANRRASVAATDEKTASAAFAAQIAQEAGAEVFPSGLVFVPMTEGDGEMPSATDTVRVHYHGTLRDGSVFDSSVDRGESISFPLSGVIPCWTEGVQKIRVGGKAKLVCPSDIAYGDRGTPGIPAGATLLFEVELLGIE